MEDGLRSPTPPPHKAFAEAGRKERQLDANAEAYKAAGNKFFRMQAYEQAIAEYDKAVQSDPTNPVYLSNRSAALMSAHRYHDALQDAKHALDIDTGNDKVMLRIARIHTALGQPSEALDILRQMRQTVNAQDQALATAMFEHLEQAIKFSQDKVGASMALHALDQAERGLGRGVPPPRRWRLIRGEVYLKISSDKFIGDTLDLATSLLRANSQDPDALVLRARALYAQGENAKALQHLRQALSYDPDLKTAVSYLRTIQKVERLKEDGNAAFKAGRFQDAVNVYGAALEADPLNRHTNARILQNRALAAMKIKDYDSAISDCDRALGLDKTYLKARKSKARALGESGRWEEAVQEYKAVAAEDPSDPNIAKDIRWAELGLKKSHRKDYYKILGVEKDTGDQEIKRAYRKLAILHHPDKNPDDEKADEKFKEIGEAYETLSDPQKRARYDSGEDLLDPSDMFGGARPFSGGAMDIDPQMLFNMMGGGVPGGFSFSTGGGPFGGNRGNSRTSAGGGFPSGFRF